MRWLGRMDPGSVGGMSGTGQTGVGPLCAVVSADAFACDLVAAVAGLLCVAGGGAVPDPDCACAAAHAVPNTDKASAPDRARRTKCMTGLIAARAPTRTPHLRGVLVGANGRLRVRARRAQRGKQ